MPLINSHVDAVWIATAEGHVTGTDGGGASAPRNMTGTLDAGTNLNFVISYPSGSIPSLGFTSAPSGSILLQMPLGTSGGPNADYFQQTLHWNVSMIPGTASDDHSSPLATISNYRILPYAHNSASGSYLFGFQRLSGSANAASGFTLAADAGNFTSGSWIGEVPQDLQNPGNMACRWSFFAVGRKTLRRF